MRRYADRAGYSLIEVMTAVAIMIVGSTGVAMMVGATTRANDDAWETTTAMNFASTWMERVKRDATAWTAAGKSKAVNSKAKASERMRVTLAHHSPGLRRRTG